MLSLLALSGLTSAAQTAYESWNVPENSIVAGSVSSVYSFTYEAPNGNVWFLTNPGGNRVLNYLDVSTGDIYPVDYLPPYSCCTEANPSPNDTSTPSFVSDSSGKVWFTGFDYSVTEINTDANGNPQSWGDLTWLPPATGHPDSGGDFGGSNWGPKFLTVGSDDTFWYVNGYRNIKNTQQDGTLIQEFDVPGVSVDKIEGMVFDANGDLWMAIDGSNRTDIVKLDTSTGDFTAYPLDYNKGFNIELKVFGPDGNIWFIHDNINISGNPMAVGKITPSGDVTYIPGVTASDIQVGHDNNIVLTSRDFEPIRLLDTTTNSITTYGQSNHTHYRSVIKSSDANSYWYVTYHDPTLPSYTSTYSNAITKATLDEVNGSAMITSPANNSYSTTSSVQISTSISDPDGIANVSLYANGELVNTINNPSINQSIIWDTSSLADNQYKIFIRIEDSAGSTTDSSAVTIALDKDAGDGFTPGVDRYVVDKPTTNGDLYYITEGPDKNIWGIYSGNKIFSFNPCTETFAEYLTPTTNLGSPASITDAELISGSDGNIWYVDRDNNGISKISTDGVITQFDPLPVDPEAYNTWPPSIRGIVEDNDGNIWYSAYFDFKVGYIDSNGDFVDDITLSYRPEDIAIGSDGYIWVSQGGGTGTKISKIDPTTKAVTDFTVPQHNTTRTVDITDLEQGVDGNIWYLASQSDSDFIGFVTPDGTFTNFTLPATTNPYNITPDYEGNKMWFTYAGDSGVGYFDLNDNSIHRYSNSDLLSNLSDIKISSEGVIWYAMRSFGTSIGTINLGAAVDCDGPQTTITKPTANTLTNANTISTSIITSDNTSVENLTLFINNVEKLSIDNPDATETNSVSISDLSDGSHTFKAVASDPRGTTTTKTVTFNVDRTKPTVNLTAPAANATVSGTVTLSASVSDTNGVASVKFSLSGTSFTKTDTASPFSTSLNTANYPDGTYTLTATATDKAGNVASTSRSLTIANEDDEPEVEGETTVCHFPGTQEEGTLSVANSALQGHLNHGDYIGPCVAPAAPAFSVFLDLDDVEEREEIDILSQPDNTVLAIINEDSDLSDVNLELDEQETLVVNGSVGDIEAKNGSTVKGTGVLKNVIIRNGADISPGESPGCLTVDSLLLEGSYTFELAGTEPCTGYDQIRVNGDVELKGQLNIVTENFTPALGDTFVIILNNSENDITNIFTGLTEGATIERGNVTYTVSYEGGDGNDVTLEVTDVTDTPTPETEEDTTTPEATEEDEDSSLIFIAGGAIFLLLIGVGIAAFNKQSD